MSGIGSKEHHDLVAVFEQQFKGYRLDKEDKSMWPRGCVYQNGETNAAFLMFRKGYELGKFTARNEVQS